MLYKMRKQFQNILQMSCDLMKDILLFFENLLALLYILYTIISEQI